MTLMTFLCFDMKQMSEFFLLSSLPLGCARVSLRACACVRLRVREKDVGLTGSVWKPVSRLMCRVQLVVRNAERLQ